MKWSTEKTTTAWDNSELKISEHQKHFWGGRGAKRNGQEEQSTVIPPGKHQANERDSKWKREPLALLEDGAQHHTPLNGPKIRTFQERESLRLALNTLHSTHCQPLQRAYEGEPLASVLEGDGMTGRHDGTPLLLATYSFQHNGLESTFLICRRQTGEKMREVTNTTDSHTALWLNRDTRRPPPDERPGVLM